MEGEQREHRALMVSSVASLSLTVESHTVSCPITNTHLSADQLSIRTCQQLKVAVKLRESKRDLKKG